MSAADPSFPHLEIARDPERMLDVFRRHLRPASKVAYQILECRIVRMRYTQARSRIILEYTLLLEELDKGGKLSQRVTGVMYAGGRTRQVWEQLRASDPERENPGAYRVFAPLSYIPELDMLVQVFPYDQQLPSLPLLWRGTSPELEPSLLASFGAGDWRTEKLKASPLRYIAGTRATLRLTLQAQEVTSSRAEERRFYAKVYPDEEQAEQTYQILQTLWNDASARGANFAVGRVVAYLSNLRLLVQEEVPGTSLRDMLIREDEIASDVRKAARALAALHLGHVSTPRRRLPREEAASLEKISQSLGQSFPHLRAELEEIVGAVVAGLEGGPYTPVHGDLGLDHIFFDGDRLFLIDLDDFAEANPMLDVARVLSQLTVMQVLSILPHDRAEMAARTFTGEYFAHVPEDWHAMLPLYYAIAILKGTVGVTRRPEPEQDKVEALVREAKDSVAGRVWW